MKKYTGWIVLSTLILYLMSVAGWIPLWAPTLAAWSSNALMWRLIAKNGQRQSLVLMVAGGAALLFAGSQGLWLPWPQIFAVNLPLLGMFVAVSFLALANVESEQKILPQGNRALIATAFGSHLLGAVINLSVLFVFGDRLQRNGALSDSQRVILARCFSAAAWWSPFFVATGVAITYAPGLHWQGVLWPGLLMALIAIGLSILEVSLNRKVVFEGYPIRVESLIMPLFLAVAVMLAHFIWSGISVLVLICLLAPVGAMMFMRGGPDLHVVHEFINYKLANIGSQFALFLAAGIFSAGIKAVILLYPDVFDLTGFEFDPWLFSVVLAVMITAGMVGIHPIVSVSVVSPLLLPLSPDPVRLGFLYLSCWAISTGTSPLTGVGLALMSRYQATAGAIIKNNWHYTVFMWGVASAVNAWVL
ncbi:hypothetical protein [Gynuella sunshinyii]|uniref:Di-and tricarboxylate transporter n=1 Tax=Gynuella sunshinyii YC6258 TaxID=1445510 RepID=A0A0C5W2R0_9GAMM|nr:hypothetical protein [Gynuella sunshinyii]AJQ96959.1 hypothetical Protein YC6258_04927 [Gynuella sunshinyii YC6258]